MNSPESIIKQLNLSPHPEGGFFRELSRSEEVVGEEGLPGRYPSKRCLFTSIYYFLPYGDFSAFHRIRSDEIWCFHRGSPVRLHLLSKEGEYTTRDLGAGVDFQIVIPAFTWFAATPIGAGGSLVTCIVAPGFEYEDFELADREELQGEYPEHTSLIELFTRESKRGE